MINDLVLIQPTIDFEKGLIEYKQQFNNSMYGIEGSNRLVYFDQMKDWLEHVFLCESNNAVTNTINVPSKQFLLINKTKKKVIGMSNLRMDLNEYLLNYGGHIGYSVAPSERKQGYGTIILKKSLEKARENGIDKVLVTCRDRNTGSKKIIEANNGILENKLFDTDSNQWIRRYWIENSFA